MKPAIADFKRPFVKLTILFISVQVISYIFLVWEYNSSNDHNIANMIASFILIPIVLSLAKKRFRYLKKTMMAELLVISTFLSWFIAEILYGLVNYIPQSIVYPSSADLFYVMGYVFFIMYLYQRNKIYKLQIRIILSSIITLSLFIFYFLYVSFVIFHIFDLGNDTLSIVLSFLYPILDAYIAIIAILYYFQVKIISLDNEHASWLFVSLCGIMFFIGDFIYGYGFILNTKEYPINFFNLYYNIGYSFLGIAYLLKFKYAYHFSSKYEKI